MGSNDDSRLVTHTDDKSRLPPKAGRKLLTVTSETESGGKVRHIFIYHGIFVKFEKVQYIKNVTYKTYIYGKLT